jgi:uncharacterized protein YacL (UPF0231 family)
MSLALCGWKDFMSVIVDRAVAEAWMPAL